MKAVQLLMMNKQIEGLGYGYLYNWYAASHANFAPTDWHVPTRTEFNTLISYLGGSSVAGGKLKETGLNHWYSPNTGATNNSGFTAFGSGKRTDAGAFQSLTVLCNLWTLTTPFSASAYQNQLAYDATNVFTGILNYKSGLSVRLIKNSTTLSDGETSTMTDEDGNVYDTICIGTQEWTVQNWKCTKLNNGTSLTKVTNSTMWAAAGSSDYYYCAYNNDESNV